MPSACGVSWDDTSGGKLEESAIPNDDFESHYINDGETKSESSFPVVDGNGSLRAGNVNSAWDMRSRGDGVSEECVKELAAAFDENPLPESAMENAVHVEPMSTDDTFGLNFQFSAPRVDALADGFNEHGVRINDDGSVDVRFNVMEPGVRKGYKITPEFLERTMSKDYSRLPVQLDHSDSQRANVGYIDPTKMKFADNFARMQLHVPNTGSSIRDDVIADFTHDPPAIGDASMGFDPKTIEVKAPESADEPPEFVDGRIREVSLTPFPGGYDNGGITPAFSDAIEDAVSEQTNGDTADESCGCDAESQLITRPYTIN